MRIVEIREKTVSIASPIQNAYIDFSKMTCSVVALITDVMRDGKPVVGYGFNSNGRYGQGSLMRERFFPRLMAGDGKNGIAIALFNGNFFFSATERQRCRIFSSSGSGW